MYLVSIYYYRTSTNFWNNVCCSNGSITSKTTAITTIKNSAITNGCYTKTTINATTGRVLLKLINTF